MPSFTTVATCSLGQFAMDFFGNAERIKESIRIAKTHKAKYRLGPELEVCGYGCEDHFFESDTVDHSWEVIRDILRSDLTDNIVCDFGMPVIHDNVRYNCRVYCLNRKILLIRPKACLADDGNYRESRWFTAWTKGYTLTSFALPRDLREVTGQSTVPFGVGAIRFNDTMLGCETCEELFTPENPGIVLGLGGCEIIGNGSGSHHTQGKLGRRLELIQETTRKNGGLYMYANEQGCDGGRLYFDGAAIIVMNGQVIAQGTQFSMKDVEVITAQVDLHDIGNYRTAIASRGVQAAKSIEIPKVDVDFYVADDSETMSDLTQTKVADKIAIMAPEEEIGAGPACWLWDYLRRSGMGGFFLPLSGGTDSATCAAMVAIMCQMLFNVINGKSARDENHPCLHAGTSTKSQTLQQLRKVIRDPKFEPKSPQHIAGRLFYTCFMKTRHSTEASRARAEALAKEIGANFSTVDIEPMVSSALDCYEAMSGARPDISARNTQQNVAVQNLQARCRMVFSYLCAQMSLHHRGTTDAPIASASAAEPWPGSLLVIGASNLDACLAGHYTKFGESSADINPIGSLSKVQMIKFLKWAAANKNMPTLATIAACAPSAELQPLISNTINPNAPSPMRGFKISPTSAEACPPGAANAEGGFEPTCSHAASASSVNVKEETATAASVSSEECPAIADDAQRFYEEYDQLAALRMNRRLGPFSMFRKLMQLWGDKYTPEQIADRVKDFFVKYAKNRHKATVLPPAYHLENHSADDNRFDMRQIIYEANWRWQFDAIDRQLQREMSRKRAREEE